MNEKEKGINETKKNFCTKRKTQSRARPSTPRCGRRGAYCGKVGRGGGRKPFLARLGFASASVFRRPAAKRLRRCRRRTASPSGRSSTSSTSRVPPPLTLSLSPLPVAFFLHGSIIRQSSCIHFSSVRIYFSCVHSLRLLDAYTSLVKIKFIRRH